MAIELRVPALGESITQATVGTWLKKEGDRVEADEPLVEVESEKATVALPAPAGGVLRKILRASGSNVAVGEVIGELEAGGAAAATASPASTRVATSPPSSALPSTATTGDRRSQPLTPSVAPPEAPDSPGAEHHRPLTPSAAPPEAGESPGAEHHRPLTPSAAPPEAGGSPGAEHHRPLTPSAAPPEAGESPGAEHHKPLTPSVAPPEAARSRGAGADGPLPRGPVRAPPSVRRLMAESGLEAATLGRGPVLRRADVERAIEARGAPSPGAPPPEQAPVSRERVVPMTPLRRTVARRLLEAQQNAAILTTFNEIDMSRVLALREKHGEAFLEKHGVKLGFMSFFVKASVEALRAWPAVNAEARGSDIVYKDHYDVGVAVGGGKGLVVPVLRDADQLGFAEIEKRIAELAKKARENRITMLDLEGGTFTISNGGIYGSLLSTPILNPPQSGILGLHKIEKRPVAGPDDTVVVRPMMYVALSYDHRLVDGREAVSFLVRVKECIEDPERLLLEA